MVAWDTYQTSEDIYEMFGAFSGDPEKIKGAASVLHIMTADALSKGRYTTVIGAAALPMYLTDPRMEELKRDIYKFMVARFGVEYVMYVYGKNDFEALGKDMIEFILGNVAAKI